MRRTMSAKLLTLVMALVLTGAAPALAHSFTKSSTVTGPNCTWTGTLARSVASPYSPAYGKTQSANCLTVLSRLNYRLNGVNQTIQNQAANGTVSASVAFSDEANWMDANVKFGGVWYGFRVNH